MNRMTLALAVTLTVLPAAVSAQTNGQDSSRMRDTSRMRGRSAMQDSTGSRSNRGGTSGSRRSGRTRMGNDSSGAMGSSETGMGEQTGSSSQGSNGTRSRSRQGTSGGGQGSMGLTSDQITQLQTALNDAGCNAGTADGKMGAHTRSAMACARKQKGLTGNNSNELFRSLNLSFTSEDSVGMGGTMRSGGRGNRGSRSNNGNNDNNSSNGGNMNADDPARSAVNGDSAQVGGSNRGRIYPPADSMHRSRSNNARPARQAQQGRGMHDSTTARPPR